MTSEEAFKAWFNCEGFGIGDPMIPAAAAWNAALAYAAGELREANMFDDPWVRDDIRQIADRLMPAAQRDVS